MNTRHTKRELTRRQFGAIAGGAMVSLALSGATGTAMVQAADPARLKSRPRANGKTTASGEHPLNFGAASGRDGFLHLPPRIPDGPMPLLVLLHGASSSAEIQFRRFGARPDEAGVAVLAIDSRGETWDAIRGDFGPDVGFMDRALDYAFRVVNVDPARITLGGFSDGATYALSLGLVNGDLFPRVVAFSPGFVIPHDWTGKPKVFISHGTADPILPIDQCSRRIVPELRQKGYDVNFREFDGGHMVPDAVVVEAMAWIAAPPQKR